jgi:hypothetical protein
MTVQVGKLPTLTWQPPAQWHHLPPQQQQQQQQD